MAIPNTGCLQLLEILEISWNLKTLLEISWNLIGPPGNFCVRCQRSTALVFSHKNMDKYSLQKYEIYRHQMCFLSSRCTKTRFRPGLCPGPLWGSLWRSPRFLFGWGELKYPYYEYFSSPKEAEARQTCPGFFLKSPLESPGNLLD